MVNILKNIRGDVFEIFECVRKRSKKSNEKFPRRPLQEPVTPYKSMRTFQCHALIRGDDYFFEAYSSHDREYRTVHRKVRTMT